MGELAASIAHELNNPLAIISLRVESLLSQTAADDPGRRQLEVVEQEVDRMADLVANLLQFSRRGQPQASTVDVADDLVKTLELVQHNLRTHRIRVVQELAPDLPLIQADRQLLRQVLVPGGGVRHAALHLVPALPSQRGTDRASGLRQGREAHQIRNPLRRSHGARRAALDAPVRGQ